MRESVKEKKATKRYDEEFKRQAEFPYQSVEAIRVSTVPDAVTG
jgi:hypothetical protein